MKKRSNARGPRRSFSPRGRSSLTASFLRVAVALTAFVVVSGVALFSLRFPLPAQFAQLLKGFPKIARPAAEQAPFSEAARASLRALAGDAPPRSAPAAAPLSSFSMTIVSARGPDARARDAGSLLARARSPLAAAHVAGDERLMSLSQTVDGLTQASASRKVIALLPGERLRLELPIRPAGSTHIEARVRCLAATADRLDVPGKGTLTIHEGGAMPFEISPRGEPAWLALDGRAGEVLEISWPDDAPGFLSIEGWRGDVFPRGESALGGALRPTGRGLLVVAIDGLPAKGDEADRQAALERTLPGSWSALGATFGENNVASFSRVMPSSTEANEALKTLLTGELKGVGVNSGASASGLYTDAARIGLPSVFARLEPASDAPAAMDEGAGDPLVSLHFPRRSEIRGAIGEALAAQDWSRPTLSTLYVTFPAERLFPTWATALGTARAALPLHLLSGAGRSFGIEPANQTAAEEKRVQLDEALARFLSDPRLSRTHDVAVVALRGANLDDAQDPVPPDAGFAWIASRSFAGRAPRTSALVSLRALHKPLARSLRQGASEGSLSELALALVHEESHAVTTTDQGVWHLFPYGRVLIPTRAAGARPSRYVWDVPLDRTRETQKALGAYGNAQKEQALHLFFPPNGIKERVAASVSWRRDPIACATVPSEGESQARGVVDLDEKTGRRLWITGVADPAHGLHIVCSSKGDTRPASLVEMHFERGSQSLPLQTVGLGEFALPLAQREEGVQLAQTRYDEISPLLEAQFAPSWRALEGYKLLLWNDPNPALALDGLQPLELQRKDREPEAGPTGAPASGGASGDAALPNAHEARAQRLLESKP